MLLDEDSQAKYLVNLLQAAGHDVATVNTAVLKKVRYALCPMPYALCPMPYSTSSF